ncbi:RsmB/NOP family class I SAM-dependent RNA methyltransferase [Paludisphaera mucosa]|uniref:RsmB/NOP family class I SAM-dependent RNA methyltransferase n=1 Tax=Paludisphaera mucosa TaxID=3030827 RepID=A0ABT6F9K6_9BACT|nr:RsmB/NOP family class I SAM-dependent RNA methyltransferase [Paludisphaera mucosa]MDG3004257.1 RsmB/NOP family class I SAM-dependent RNA methyltransferase [Paludisphaera mucosa]
MARKYAHTPRRGPSSTGPKSSGPKPSGAKPKGERPRPTPQTAPRGKSMPALASLIATLAPKVLRDVLDRGKRLESAIVDAQGADAKKRSTRSDRKLINKSLASLVRWWGWIEPLKLVQVEDQLLLAWLLDSTELPAVPRIWASKTAREYSRLSTGGDAPGWTARAETLKRFVAGRAVTADPWMLFPAWLRDELPLPPGEESAKARRLTFLHAVQAPPSLWVAVRGRPPKEVWDELVEAGHEPWVQRHIDSAARLEGDVDLRPLESFQAGALVAQDLGSQAVAHVCDPDPGERWWDLGDGSSLLTLGLADAMNGKGTIVSTFEHEPARRAAALRLRTSPFRNVAAKAWDGRRPPGKPGTFDGVLVAPPSSGVGSWRRHPEVRWIVKKEQLAELAARQKQLLELAATAVRPGGTLVYTVGTATLRETQGLINEFLQEHPEFRLDPFPHPLEETPTTGMVQLWPQVHDCESRFLARLVRTSKPAAAPAS